MDFNNPKSEAFWIQGLKNLTEVYNGPQPSGIWLDMNDPSSFTISPKGEVLNPDKCILLDAFKKDEADSLISNFNKAAKMFIG